MSLNFDEPILVDTNILIYFLRTKEDGRRVDKIYRFSENLERIHLSAITLAEIGAIAKWRRWGAERIRNFQRFADQAYLIETLNPDTVQNYSEFYVESLKRGKGIGQNDLWLAATARAYDLTLLTADSDFQWIPSDLLKIEFFQPGTTS